MSFSIADRLSTLFILEISWLLCVLQLADTPWFAGVGGATIAVVLCLGALCLAIMVLTASSTPPRSFNVATIQRGIGIVLLASGLLAAVTSSPATGGLNLACLGLVLAATASARGSRSS